MSGLNGPRFGEDDELIETGEWPPDDAEKILELTLYGEQVPAGSKEGYVIKRKENGVMKVVIEKDAKGNERAFVTITDTNSKRLKKQAKEIGDQVMTYIFEQGFQKPGTHTPLAVEVTFFTRPRPGDQYGTGRNAGILKRLAKLFPTGAPDATKLWRAVEDHLTDLLWHDDSKIVSQQVHKRYGKTRIEFTLYRLPEFVGDVQDPEPEQGTLL